MIKHRLRMKAQHLLLLFGSLFFSFLVIELGYRLLDPIPFFPSSEVNRTEHGNLSTYDETLGWKGLPSGKAEIVTHNSRVWIEHNRSGFRDIEHNDRFGGKPVIVFLGDSFTWGYEVEFEEIFIKLLTDMLPEYEIFNLAHRGYGTDQELLAFRHWRERQKLKLVVLMFSENDVTDNNSDYRYDKPKPMYRLVDGELQLVGVPVPKVSDWTQPPDEERTANTWKQALKERLYRSHAFHDLYLRFGELRNARERRGPLEGEVERPDLSVTSRILEEVKREAGRRGALLVVAFIPSKREIEQLDDSLPYQVEIAAQCDQLGIGYLDMAPGFKDSWHRTYYREGMHWNARGHQVAADALYEYLTANVSS